MARTHKYNHNLSEGLPVINDTTNLSERLPVINDTTNLSEGLPIINDTTDLSEGLPVINDTTNLSEGLPAINNTTDLSEGLPVINDISAKMTFVIVLSINTLMTCVIDDLYDCLFNQRLMTIWSLACLAYDLCGR